MKEKNPLNKVKKKINRTESVWAKEVFSNGQQSLQSIIGSSPIPAFIIGKDHLIIYWNKALEELSGIKAREVVGTGQQWRAFYKTARPCMADLLVDKCQKKIPQWYSGKHIKSKLIKGAYEATDFFPELGKRGKWLRFTAAVIRNSKGSVIGAVETLEDITQAKRTEEALLQAHAELEMKVKERTRKLTRTNKALKETTDHLSLILEFLPIISYACHADENATITFVSNRVKEITGYTPAQFTGNHFFWQEHIHPEDRDHVLKKLKSTTGKRTQQLEYRFQIMDGSYRWIADHRRLIKPGKRSRSYLVGAWQDITEDKKIRQEGEFRLQQMIQSHKLKALGEVVAGVAHEINNPVSFIANNITMLEEMWNAVEPILASDGASHPDWSDKGIGYVEVCTNMKEIIDEFKIASQRIKRVVSGLKEFARTDETVEKKPVKIEEVIRGVMIIVGAQVRKTVSRVDIYVDSDLPPVQGHFQKLEQVIANLLINAHQAIPPDRKGRIIITARNMERLNAILIEIEDNGMGMKKEVMDHVFQPFFTTRRDLEGTGLGLSISYGLIKEHHGLIGVLSRPDIGTRFSIYLPLDSRTPISIRPAILCCDSDASYLNEIKMSFVDALDWQCSSEDTCEDIITYLEAHPEIDIFISEINLPSMNGWELSRKIKERFPLMCVILYSADDGSLKSEGGTADQADYLLKKPFSMMQLQNIIRDTGRQRL
ncbi:MAG TPA: PAS domain S-box protein [Smithella sp.]|nr:PAS domain S-box protein [Smithella sp.]MDM7987508.1 PAS domain S-box protein [Smithella sp.]HNY50645.1 PAS domain S-box protein [Smithella sp.]HOG89100.1 PAS domain S-box protein [Smithella sp.]HOU50220.1 PAS domain S-box protein [Smithella sp.]